MSRISQFAALPYLRNEKKKNDFPVFYKSEGKSEQVSTNKLNDQQNSHCAYLTSLVDRSEITVNASCFILEEVGEVEHHDGFCFCCVSALV